MADKSQAHDKQVLHKLGYAQELSRRMSGFSNFAISFSIICILAGGISAFPAAFNALGSGGAVDRRVCLSRLDRAAGRAPRLGR